MTFVNRNFRDIKMTIDVIANRRLHFLVNFSQKITKDFSKSSYRRITKGLPYNLTLRTDPNSTVIIDDSVYGKRFIRTDVGPYYHTIRVKHPTATDKIRRVYIEPSGQLKLSIYDRPDRKTAYICGLIPGLSQFYKNQKLKGALFVAASAGVFAHLLHKEEKFRSDKLNYNRLHKRYLTDSEELIAYQDGLAAQKKFQTMNRAARVRDIAIAAALSVYVANILDAFFATPKSGYRIKTGVYADFANKRTSVNLDMKVSF